ncbi:hypothetical protein [Mesorhizobium sp. BAC0120]|uniref:hypothetical protein n=1 Tax=Mesorhizobium sp. BAC0120 TaxID=3090670 RepID=UPI00399BF1EF
MLSSLGRVTSITVISVALATAACTTEPTHKTASVVSAATDEMSTQPATATYSCADGGMMTIENLGSSVRILSGAGEPIELPAAPPAQRARYGEQPYALVLDGREALFMKSGEEPLACTR